MAFRSLRKRKTRTALTVSGIAVGVAMILVLFSLAAGASTSTGGLLRNLLSAEITVVNNTVPSFTGTGGGGFGGGQFNFTGRSGGGGGFFAVSISGNLLSQDVADQIGKMTDVYAVSSALTFVGSVDNTSSFVYGVDSSYSAATNGLNIVNGTMLDSSSSSNVIVLESTMATNLNLTVGSVVDLSYNSTDEGNFTVVGIYSAGETFGPTSRSSYITLANAQNITQNSNEVSQIYVKTDDPTQVSTVASLITSTISGVTAQTANSFTGTASTLSNTLTSFFEVIGLVALLAGGFGVVNTMMMSVTERTREIGTLKAIGAKGGQIMRLFMGEALMIGILGAIVGVLVGGVVGLVLPMLSGSSSGTVGTAGRALAGFLPGRLSVALTPYNIGLSLLAGTLVGVIAGILPAWRASKLDPVEALRHV